MSISPNSASYRFEYLEYIDVIADASRINSPTIREIYLTKLVALERTLKHLENVGIDATVVFQGKEENAMLLSEVWVECSNRHFKKVLDVVTKRFCNAIC